MTLPNLTKKQLDRLVEIHRDGRYRHATICAASNRVLVAKLLAVEVGAHRGPSGRFTSRGDMQLTDAGLAIVKGLPS